MKSRRGTFTLGGLQEMRADELGGGERVAGK